MASATSKQPTRDAQRGTDDLVDAILLSSRALVAVSARSIAAAHAVTLPQFRMLAVLADLGQARSAQVARALGLDASSVTRLADRLVAAGYVTRGGDPRHRGVVTLELTPVGQQLVNQVEDWRRAELTRIAGKLTADERTHLTMTLRHLVDAAGEGYGLTLDPPVPL